MFCETLALGTDDRVSGSKILEGHANTGSFG